jgi:hypothetical protein
MFQPKEVKNQRLAFLSVKIALKLEGSFTSMPVSTLFKVIELKRHHDTPHNDIQHNGTQHTIK